MLASLGIVTLLLPRSLASPSCSHGSNQFRINGVGQTYLVGGGGTIDGDRLTVQHNSGFSAFSSCEASWKAEALSQFKLLGQVMSFTVDLGKVGCGCNLALYLTHMPARDFTGQFKLGEDRGGQPAYYCDANKVGGQWCPEVDIMEANTHAFQSTLHNCDAPTGGEYTYCDRIGCSESTRKAAAVYGPGSGYSIDTRQPFEVRSEFFEREGELVGLRTTLVQQAKQVVLSHTSCDAGYLKTLTAPLKSGMALSITYWGQDASSMAWLDSPACGNQECGASAGQGILSNISIAPIPVGTVFDPRVEPEAVEPPKNRWAAEPWAQWECHHYVGNQQEADWCSNVGYEDGFEYYNTGGQENLCGFCWCCKRAAKLLLPGDDGAPPAAPAPPVWMPPPTAALAPAPAAWTTRASTTATPEKVPTMMKGSILIDGAPGSFVAGSGGSVEGSALTIQHNSGFTIFSKEEKYWQPDGIEELKLLGKTLVYTVDLSKVGCACNLAFYLIAMPAMGPQGLPSAGTNRGGQPPYYCDANMVGGQWCPEIDIMEANNHAFQATLHRCEASVNQQFSMCDRGGCEQNTREHSNAYGPSAGFTIDTRHPFHVETEFLMNDGLLTGMRSTLRQNGRFVVMEHPTCNQQYLAALSEVMAHGMSLRITYWGDQPQTMAWMDVPPCGGGICSGEDAGDGVISNIRILNGSVEDTKQVWVVWDPQDELYGHIVPREVALDGTKMGILNGHALAEWDGQRHFVQRMPRSEIQARLAQTHSEVMGLAVAPGSCGGEGQNPCDASLSQEQQWNSRMVFAKYLKLPVLSSASVSLPLLIALGLSVVLVAGLGPVVARRVCRRPRSHSDSGSLSPMDHHGQLIPSAFESPLPSRYALELGSGDQSPPSTIRRSRSGNLMAGVPPPMPRRGGSGSRTELNFDFESCCE